MRPGGRDDGGGDAADRPGAHRDDHVAVTGDITHALNTANNGKMSSEDGTGRGVPTVAVAVHENQRAEITLSETSGALKTGGGKPGQGYPATFTGTAVRRLTPTECERLQGFPDGWTDVVHRGKPAADAPRYKAIGNSMAVPVLAWIGDRIRAVFQ